MASLNDTSSVSANTRAVAAQNSPRESTDYLNLRTQADAVQDINKQHTPPHLLVSELAVRWAVSPASIYRMIESQALGHMKVRGAIRIPHHVVLDYEAEQLEASTKRVEAA